MKSDQIDIRVQMAAKMFHVHPRDLIGDYRYGFLMLPRFALAKALRMRGLSTPNIGKIMHRDHTTIIYQLRKVEYYMERDPAYRRKIEELSNEFSKLVTRIVMLEDAE